MSKYQNAKRFFVTAKADVSAGELVAQSLGDRCDVPAVFDSGGVWLSRVRVTDLGHLIPAGETLRVYLSPFQSKKYILKPEQIVFEDEQVLIVHKPAAVTSVPDRSDLYHNMTAAVHDYLRKQGNFSKYSPLTRLDFMVSGLMLFAKTPYAIRRLTQDLQERKIFKLYEATLRPALDLPKLLHVKNKLDFLGKAFESESGREAHSLFRFKRFDGECPVYSVVLFSGRRHQIRVHAAQYLSPIVGDDLYGKREKDESEVLGLRSVALNFKLLGKRYRIRLEGKGNG